jgi:hypothetical protein
MNEFPGCTSPDWPAVAAFLAMHNELRSALVELPAAVARYFAPDQELSLAVVTDPDDGSDQLVATILTPFSPNAALQRLDHFDQQWWLERAMRYEHLTVTIESIGKRPPTPALA